MTGTTSQGGKPPGNPLRQLHATHRASSCAKRGGHVQLCSKPRGARGIEPKTFQRGDQLLSRPPTTGPWSTVHHRHSTGKVTPSGRGIGYTQQLQSSRIRWRHSEHLLFECPGISGRRGSLTFHLFRDDLVRACTESDHAQAVLLAMFPSDRSPVVAATACLVPFLLDPAAALGRHPLGA